MMSFRSFLQPESLLLRETVLQRFDHVPFDSLPRRLETPHSLSAEETVEGSRRFVSGGVDERVETGIADEMIAGDESDEGSNRKRSARSAN